MSATVEAEERTVLLRDLEDAACHADELHEVVQAQADKHDDPHLRLAAKGLANLNESLNDLAYGDE